MNCSNLGKLLEGKKSSQGFDAQNEEYVDMFAKGIIDPTKVVRSALQDAASIAGLLITTEAMIADKPEDKDATPAMPDECKIPGDVVGSYRKYYVMKKQRFATWKAPATIPQWWIEALKNGI